MNADDFQLDDSERVVAVYEHPDGKVVTIYADDSYDCRKAGRKKTTSATPAKLREGYGRWKLVEQ